MIGVIVPAHNEAKLLPSCLKAIRTAAACSALDGEQVLVVVVADACTDETQSIAELAGACSLRCDAQNVGAARALGAAEALRLGARWLAFTDADTLVAADWLSCQLALRHDAVVGTVGVADWEGYRPVLIAQHHAEYRDIDGHRHIHGANLGVSRAAYLKAGGFPPLACSEDVALVQALAANGASIAWSARPRVFTSVRRDYRAAGGFGASVERLAQTLEACDPATAS